MELDEEESDIGRLPPAPSLKEILEGLVTGSGEGAIESALRRFRLVSQPGKKTLAGEAVSRKRRLERSRRQKVERVVYSDATLTMPLSPGLGSFPFCGNCVEQDGEWVWCDAPSGSERDPLSRGPVSLRDILTALSIHRGGIPTESASQSESISNGEEIEEIEAELQPGMGKGKGEKGVGENAVASIIASRLSKKGGGDDATAEVLSLLSALVPGSESSGLDVCTGMATGGRLKLGNEDDDSDSDGSDYSNNANTNRSIVRVPVVSTAFLLGAGPREPPRKLRSVLSQEETGVEPRQGDNAAEGGFTTVAPDDDRPFPPHVFVSPEPGAAFEPSPFQTMVLEMMDARRAEVGHAWGLATLATGVGKTVLAAIDAGRQLEMWNREVPGFRGFVGPRRRPFRLLFVVHTKEILRAAERTFRRHFTAPNQPDPLPAHRFPRLFTFTLFQSLHLVIGGANGNDAGGSIAPGGFSPPFTHVIVDECHHAMADVYFDRLMRVLGCPGVAQGGDTSASGVSYLLGLTATRFRRGDETGFRLLSLFRHTLYCDYDWISAKRHGLFPRVEYLEVACLGGGSGHVRTYAEIVGAWSRNGGSSTAVGPLVRSLDRSLASAGMLDSNQVRHALSADGVAALLGRYHALRVESGLPPHRKVLVFTSSIDRAEALTRLLNSDHPMGPAEAVHSRKKQGKRSGGSTPAAGGNRKRSDGDGSGAPSDSNTGGDPAAVLRSFASPDCPFRTLVSVGMITEGFDLPACDCVVLARATESEVVFVQQMGRGLRRDPEDPGKQVVIIDLALNLRRRWRRLVSELPDAVVAGQVRAFWHVTTFDPAGHGRAAQE